MGMFDFTDRVAVITGSTAGLGKGMAIALARQNCNIALIARRADKLEEAAAEIRTLGVKCLPVPCDVTSDESVANAADAIIREFGRVDILVNNAGTGGPACPVAELPMETYKNLVELNMTSVFRMIKTFVPYMEKAGYGRIVNVASVLGMVGHLEVSLAGYASAKGGVISLTKGVAAELATKGITVNAIAPGFFVTRQNEGLLYEEDGKPAARTAKVLAATPMGRFGRPEELNGALMFLLNNEAAGFITGIILPVDGGFSAYSGV